MKKLSTLFRASLLALSAVLAFGFSSIAYASTVTVDTSGEAGVVLQGSGFVGVDGPDTLEIIITPTAGGTSSPGTTTVTNGSFTYVNIATQPATAYSYVINVASTGMPIYNGTFTTNAAPTTGNGSTTSTGNGTTVSTGAGDDNGLGHINFNIPNPVTGFDNLPDLIVELLKIVMLIASPIIAIMIIYAGYMFVTASGDPKKIGAAKDMLLYVVIGAAIILGAEIIAKAIQGTVNSLL